MIKVRCSSLGQLMTDPKTNAAKAAGELSETAKGVIEDLWLRNEYGYSEEVITDEMLKGLQCEQDGMKLVQQVLGGQFRMKHRDFLENDWITGTPDIVLPDWIEDIKTSFTVKTFFQAELVKAYEWQMRGYMWLTGKSKARVIYCLVSTPDSIVTELKKRVYFRFNCDEENEDYVRISKRIDKNHSVEHIPAEQRVKVFEVYHDDAKIEELKARIEQGRNYYKTLKLV